MSYTKNTNMIQFKRKNRVTAVDVSIRSILWNYICWVLAGKPDNHTFEINKIKKK